MTRGGALRAISCLAVPLLRSCTKVHSLAYSPQNAILPRTASTDANLPLAYLPRTCRKQPSCPPQPCAKEDASYCIHRCKFEEMQKYSNRVCNDLLYKKTEHSFSSKIIYLKKPFLQGKKTVKKWTSAPKYTTSRKAEFFLETNRCSSARTGTELIKNSGKDCFCQSLPEFCFAVSFYRLCFFCTKSEVSETSPLSGLVGIKGSGVLFSGEIYFVSACPFAFRETETQLRLALCGKGETIKAS